MPKEDDLFYFMQCATVASPKDKAWPLRLKEERYALQKYMEYLKYLEGTPWITLQPTGDRGNRWVGEVTRKKSVWRLELVLKDAYPYTPPAIRVPELMDYTDRKVDDGVLGLRICDMHVEAQFWWDQFCSIALYLKREVSYWVESVATDMERKGWL